MALGTIGTLGTDPNYGALGVQHDPRLLMAQKLMDVGTMPTNNSTQSSFWANLLAQGARGGLGGYMYGDVQADREKERVAQEAEAKTFREKMERGPPGGSGAAPAQPSGSPAPRADAGGGSAGGDLVAAVHHLESRGRMAPGIYGDGGQAAGPMQVHPGALADVNRAQGTNYTHEQLASDPELGRQVGVAYLTQLRQQFGRDDYALGAYNAGPGVMRAAIANGQGVAGLPPRTQQYVTEGLARMRGRQADAGDTTPGSNMEALLSGVDAPKPRGIQLAANLLPNGVATDAPTPILPQLPDASPPSSAPGGLSPKVNALFDAIEQAKSNQARARVALGGGGNTATDTPTPILSAPVVPVASAALQGVPGPQPPSADVPQPPTESVPAPPAATAPPPDLAPPIQPDASSGSAPAPTPVLGNTAAPLQANALPPSPLANADPATLASVNGAPAPDAATVPPPDQAAVPTPPAATVPAAQPSVETGPAGSGETGGQPTVLPQEEPPLPVPPVPPGLLARRLQQSAPAPGDNATEALNTASLAAARRGEGFVPGGGPSGQQLAAPLMSWAGNLGADGAPLLTPQGSSGGPTGPQLAGPLVTPASGPSGGDPGATGGQSVSIHAPSGATAAGAYPRGDGSAIGGQSKAPQAPAQPSTSDDQAKADWYLSLAREAAGSSNPKIRAQAGVLEAQGTALQRRIDRQETAAAQAQARQDNLDLRRQAAADAAAGRAETAADRKARIEMEQKRLDLETQRADPKTLDAAEQRKEDHALAVKGLRWQPGSNRTVQEQIPNTSPPGAQDFGNSEDARALNAYRDLYPVMARGKPTDQQRADYEAARTVLLKPKTQLSQSGQTIETPGRLPDLGRIYGPVPNEAPVPTEQALPQGAYRTGSGSIVYPGPQQPVPEKVTAEMLTNVNGLRQVQAAAESLRKNPDAVGPIAGAFPQVRSWFDASGVPTQAMIAAIRSVKVHEISGAAVTAAEEPRLLPWIPDIKDKKEVALAKLERFATEYGNILRDKYEVYGPDTNHQANPVVERALLASPMEYTGDKAYDHMKSGQVYRAPDGQLRTKQ